MVIAIHYLLSLINNSNYGEGLSTVKMTVMMCGVHLCLEPSMYTGTGFFIAGVLVKKSVRWQYEIGGKNVIVKEGRLFIYACNDRFTAYFQSL